MNRRKFLQASALGAGALAFGPLLAACSEDERDRAAETALGAHRLLDRAPADAPIDTVVVLVMENRSFDHYLGWLGADTAYLDAGRAKYGHNFHVSGRQLEHYTDAQDQTLVTRHLPSSPTESNPYRGCEHRIPGHGWNTGRIQRDHGFAARGSGNDSFALGYYEAPDVAMHADLARRFTVADNYFSSLLAGTFPNRQYVHAATSLGHKEQPAQLDVGVYGGETIWDRLQRAGVPARYYYTDLPFLALWGDRMFDRISSIDRYFEDAANGTLPNVVMVDPGFVGPDRSDNHPHGDIRMAQRYLHSVFGAFARSPQWHRGLFVVTYDEWGGFFDHVRPPVVADDRRSTVDVENFGQTGFRVPTVLASPFARAGYVDSTQYDHTSILRFLEWRFLGAPAAGVDATNGRWFLTQRDRAAHNLGSSLVTTADPELGFELDRPIPVPSEACRVAEVPPAPHELGPSDVPPSDRFHDLVTTQFRPAVERPWQPA